MASETILSPPPKTFLRVYHMMEAKWALRRAIKNQRLKVSRFENLNDPFELFALNRHTQAARKASKKFAADFNATHGLLCFGADWSNAVMWSHYGDKHKGICLGFDVRRTLASEDRIQGQACSHGARQRSCDSDSDAGTAESARLHQGKSVAIRRGVQTLR